ncbi:KGK domain-containing protein [Alkalinema sp. FACHB-956]|uniref:KGK domain-containing protein n=1 Tax=Alkalinema sp. FACHB-956 TaxID=2692768 RepID=UPI0016823DBD|nr:KGK domain-containing protein [Alkalinema sp. FACHB-956]MBD2326426.1 hypothetical protein [Alkalinema sp. FACHB-956]
MLNKSILGPFSPDDVVSFQPIGQPHLRPQMHKIGTFCEVLEHALTDSNLAEIINRYLKDNALETYSYYKTGHGRQEYSHYQNWFSEGVTCETLKTDGSGWQHGKMKITVQINVEFCPNDAESDASPLDEIRQTISDTEV